MSPPTTSQRSATPASASSAGAPSTTEGRSKSVPRSPGLARRIAAISLPWPPPTSTTRREAREVVGGHDGRRGGGREDGHAGIEHRPEPRVGGVAREGVLGAEEVPGRALAGADAVLQRAPGAPEVIVAEHQHQRAHRARRVGAQAPAERPEREAAVLALREHAEGGQRAQQAPERGRVRADGGGEVVDRPRAVGQQVGQAELRRDVERPRRLVGGGQAQHRPQATAGRRAWWGGLPSSSRPPGRATANAATASGLRCDRSGHHTTWASTLSQFLLASSRTSSTGPATAVGAASSFDHPAATKSVLI